MSNSIKVPFHGATLIVVDHDGEPYTPLKPIAEGMGLDWRGQHEKIKANEARWGMGVIPIPSKGGKQEAACIPLRKLAGWLMTLHPSRVKPELREKIVTYQNECDDALWKYWNEGVAQRRPVEQRIDVRAALTANGSAPTVVLPADVQSAINRRAWSLAHEAYELCREHLARRVAYAAEVGQPRRLDKKAALQVIAEGDLGHALARPYTEKLERAIYFAGVAAEVTEGLKTALQNILAAEKKSELTSLQEISKM